MSTMIKHCKTLFNNFYNISKLVYKSKSTESASFHSRRQLKQSLVYWCFEPYFDVPTMIKIAKQLGFDSIELIDPKYFHLLKEVDLKCAMCPIHLGDEIPPFLRGFNNRKHHKQVIEATKNAIDAAAAYQFKRVITFTGMSNGISNDVAATNCVDGYKKVINYAEKKNVTLCLEMLNTRVSDHPMKGHPGYTGNNTQYCIDIIKRVGSENLKLLFDIYHVQIMEGDLVRRIHQYKDFISHVHTAGNPGRGELDDNQEINYRKMMKTLFDIGYDGYVGHEFIPTREPIEGLKEAMALCHIV
ncbi:unnamed protein product [Didymodactylos carnosus]|uniref:Xylose isomerase-like TIM barrel domain-containing protein n=1 Tax=Didymodactylos carnosus TaxID=1234261 RepID=A0A813YF56_9BILA|nr:unnamed protein product [Didymodactylos carnosus]CAF1566794.1 unnamed protein product [Didymodactylos carnosus]CAF3669269.1 unnamed protein product [Didymodactylos carnosus]CAF4360076.1 unnamed protein product [Didymodactylos carnosus]